jgi:beta-phosphoglucomutase
MAREILAIIFDLDGVIVSTDELHYQAWHQLAEEIGVAFNRKTNEQLRGVSRMDSLEIILGNTPVIYSELQKRELANRKNEYYQVLIERLTPTDLLPNVQMILTELKNRRVKIAIGSSSKNAQLIIQRIGLAGLFDTIVDGNDISQSKPDPEVFALAARRLCIPPENCLVVEDAEAGLEAAWAAGMRVLAVGNAAHSTRPATLRAPSLVAVSVADILCLADVSSTELNLSCG